MYTILIHIGIPTNTYKQGSMLAGTRHRQVSSLQRSLNQGGTLNSYPFTTYSAVVRPLRLTCHEAHTSQSVRCACARSAVTLTTRTPET